MSQIITEYQIPLFESYIQQNNIDNTNINANISGIPLKLKIATTPESQAKGYMDELDSPNEDTGILFIYEFPQELSFWMKRVKFPLDIIFFDDNMQYINHETMEPTDIIDDYEIPRYTSARPAKFAVELQSGWCNKNMTPNCKLSF